MSSEFEESLRRRMGAVRWDDLIEPVSRALEAHDAGAAVVYDEDVRRAVRRLAEAVDGAGEHASPVALIALASFRWMQFSARSGTVAGLFDHREAVRLYEQARARVPEFPLDAMPSSVARLLGEADAGRRRLMAASDEAVQLARAGLETGDRVVLREAIEILHATLADAAPDQSGLAEARHTLGELWGAWHRVTGEAAV